MWGLDVNLPLARARRWEQTGMNAKPDPRTLVEDARRRRGRRLDSPRVPHEREGIGCVHAGGRHDVDLSGVDRMQRSVQWSQIQALKVQFGDVTLG